MRTLVVNALRMSGQRTAIGRHLEYLAQHWSQADVPFDRVVFMSPEELRVEGLGSKTPLEMRTFGGRWPFAVWEQVLLPRTAKGAALLFSEYSCPLAYDGRIVVANHGIYEAVPSAFSAWTRLRAVPIHRMSARKAERVIANSRSTRADLVRYFRVSESKIDVIYPGPADVFFEHHSEESIAREVVKAFGKAVQYLIFVGKLAKRRNVPNLIEAFSIVRKQERLPHYLLIVGPNVNNLPLGEITARTGVAEVVKHCPHLEQPELAKLYAGADAFVLPSIYEGISWTMFEAMASGTAVLTVDHPALAEGGADAVLSVRTANVSDLVEGLRALLTDPAQRRSYREKGLTRVRRFSLWESARATMELLDRVAAPSDRRLR
jgi:glycosyltransferase involved in cell wall biosynthesis